MRTCNMCHKELSETEFYKSRKGELYYRCKNCCREKIKTPTYRAYRKQYDKRPEVKKRSSFLNKSNCWVRSGKMKRELCVICGEKAEKHHPDYRKPFLVIWLCRKHHRQWHYEILPLYL